MTYAVTSRSASFRCATSHLAPQCPAARHAALRRISPRCLASQRFPLPSFQHSASRRAIALRDATPRGALLCPAARLDAASRAASLRFAAPRNDFHYLLPHRPASLICASSRHAPQHYAPLRAATISSRRPAALRRATCRPTAYRRIPFRLATPRNATSSIPRRFAAHRPVAQHSAPPHNATQLSDLGSLPPSAGKGTSSDARTNEAPRTKSDH
jgi:hypothetical protein